MAKATHKWAFKPGMRAGAYSWKSSSKAIERLKSASSEIRAVARVDPVTAAEGVIALAQRIWPAFEHIDTSSGALGNAVRRTLEELLPVLIEAPADETTRAKWLEQLREAIEDDGVDYLAPIADCFGQIAAYPSLMNLHAERDLDMIEAAWSDHVRFIHVPTATLTLSCLLEAGRYDELLALLERKKTRLWFDEKFGAEALLRQGREDEALARAEALLLGQRRQWAMSKSLRSVNASSSARAARKRPIAALACLLSRAIHISRCGAIWLSVTQTSMRAGSSRI